MRSILLAVMNLGKAVLDLRTLRLQSSGAVRELLFSVGYISIDRFEEILKLSEEKRYRLFHDFGSLKGKIAPGF